MKHPETSGTAAKPTTVRGKYANLLQQGTNVAILDPDIVEHFPDFESVNNALRAFLAIGKEVESASIHILRKVPRPVSSKRNVTLRPTQRFSLEDKSHGKVVRSYLKERRSVVRYRMILFQSMS